MQTHETPDRPWSRVSSDLFTLNCKEYVVLADSYSVFIEVDELKGTTANYIMEFLKEQFSRHGIPDLLVTDNGSQYGCREITEFSREREFKQVPSSPRLAKSNGKAESAVKVAKRISKKLTGTTRTRSWHCWINGTHQHKAQYRDWCPEEPVHCYRYQQIFCISE